MENLISQFPENILESIQIAKNSSLKKNDKNYSNVVFCGMGGSGIGGLLVSKWLNNKLKVPFQIVQDYSIPNYVDDKTLFIASSYSGNTEETLHCVEAAIKKNATLIAITSGGDLQEICEKNNLQFIKIPGGNPPRTALGYSCVQVIHILESFGLVASPSSTEDFTEACKILVQNQKSIKEEADLIAKKLHGFQVRIYSAAKYESICLRLQQQLNENAKVLCSYNVVPEMNHNELVGWGTAGKENSVLFIDSRDLDVRTQRRLELTRDVIQTKTDKVYSIQTKGDTFIQRSLYYVHLLDWVSFYVSRLNKVDILEIDVINNLKNELKLI
jgi:glucose/mannose-6-phosphate isomerase